VGWRGGGGGHERWGRGRLGKDKENGGLGGKIKKLRKRKSGGGERKLNPLLEKKGRKPFPLQGRPLLSSPSKKNPPPPPPCQRRGKAEGLEEETANCKKAERKRGGATDLGKMFMLFPKTGASAKIRHVPAPGGERHPT